MTISRAVAATTLMMLLCCSSSSASNGGDAPPAPDDGDATIEGGTANGDGAVTPPPDADSAVDAGGITCVQDQNFVASLPVPEGSSIVEVETMPGVRELVVISDSGNAGAAYAYRAPSGPGRALVLPLGVDATDDVEGSAWANNRLYTLTSSGAVRELTVAADGTFQASGAAYAIGPAGTLSCPDLTSKNCLKDYEGLCLRATAPAQGCLGYALSKQDGALLCVKADVDGHLAIDAARPPMLLTAPAVSLSDCAFAPAGSPQAGALFVTTNSKNGSTSYRVDETTGKLTKLPIAGTAHNEAITVDRGGALYVVGDTSTTPSPILRFLCAFPP